MKKGFTLIELLISITILAVLMAIVIGLYRQAMQRSRDTRKKADLTAIQHALEQYHADQGYYPTAVDFSSPSALDSCTGISGCTITPVRTYLDLIPSNNSAYVYQAIPTGCTNSGTLCTNYCLITKLEVAENLLKDNQYSNCTAAGVNNFGVKAP
jgi:prepilin-type N-terminal cleavage/methylation domain-containing protein